MRLNGARPQTSSEQLEPPLPGGETLTGRESGEAPIAMRELEYSEAEGGLMEPVLEQSNLIAALKRVKSNKGSPCIDGMAVGELATYLKEQWGRMREPGIPTALDRFIQQALLQILQSELDGGFSQDSYGF